MRKGLIFLIMFLASTKVFALEIKSDAFENGGYIPDRYSCDSQDFSPFLSWSDVPANTESLVLICDDPDAPFRVWVHWLLFNIPKNVTELKENISKDELAALGIIQGTNDFGAIGYRGPCPPAGKAHRYFFKLYALDTTLSLKEGVRKKELEEAMQGHIIAETKIMGTYQH